MKPISPVLICWVMALWVIAVAILSVQNATPVSLKFLSWQSISIPAGVVLAMSAGIGLAGGIFVQALWGNSASNQRDW
jgi:uncharacterized integral membrane protein